MTRKGMFNRIPADLHAELTRRAAEQDVSLNLLVVSLLAGAVGFKLEGSPRAGEQLAAGQHESRATLE